MAGEKLAMRNSPVTVFDASLGGHRDDYFKVISKCFFAEQVVGVSFRSFIRLISCRALLFGTCDEVFFFYFSVAFVRALIGKKTAGLVFRVGSLVAPRTVNDKMKSFFLRAINRISNISSISIVPYDEGETICSQMFRNWIYDIQFFDVRFFQDQKHLEIGEDIKKIISELNGSPFVIALGVQSRGKGYYYYQNLAGELKGASAAPSFVLAGDCSAIPESDLGALRKSGCMIINRHLNNRELFYLYDHASAVWACYHPSYDQSSGIFGRAVQMGRPVFVRKGSAIHALECDFLKSGLCYPLPATSNDIDVEHFMLSWESILASDCESSNSRFDEEVAFLRFITALRMALS